MEGSVTGSLALRQLSSDGNRLGYRSLNLPKDDRSDHGCTDSTTVTKNAKQKTYLAKPNINESELEAMCPMKKG